MIEAMKARGAEVPIPTDVVTAKTFAADAPATVEGGRRRRRRRPDPRHRPADRRSARRAAEGGRHHRLERPGRRVRVRRLRARHRDDRARHRRDRRAFSIAGGGDTLAAIAKYGIERDDRLHLHRRRRVPRSARRQDAAGVRDPRAARAATTGSSHEPPRRSQANAAARRAKVTNERSPVPPRHQDRRHPRPGVERRPRCSSG